MPENESEPSQQKRSPATPPPLPPRPRPAAPPPPPASESHRPIQAPSRPGGGIPVWAILLIVCGCLVIPLTAILAGLLLPALAKAKVKAERIKCASNLKQISLAFRIWQTDHDDHFPFNVGVTNGGTYSFCSIGPDGFDQNSWRHFQVLSNELNATQILVCPKDTSKHPAVDFSHLEPGNVSYLVHSGTNVDETNPKMVLVICPVHRNVVLCDGSIQQLSVSQMKTLMEAVAKER